MHNSLAILASGLAIGAAIYFKPPEKPQKFAVVPLNDKTLAVVDDGSVRLCFRYPLSIATNNLIAEAGFQHLEGILCGHAYRTNVNIFDISSETGKVSEPSEPKTN